MKLAKNIFFIALILILVVIAILNFTKKSEEEPLLVEEQELEEEVKYGNNKGDNIYDYELTTLDGEKTSISELSDGKKTILMFWASWCPYCKQTAPILEEFYLSGDVNVIGINGVDYEDSKDDAKGFVEEGSLTYPNVIAQDEMYENFFIESFPTIIFVNSDGVISQGVLGGLTKEIIEEQLKNMY